MNFVKWFCYHWNLFWRSFFGIDEAENKTQPLLLEHEITQEAVEEKKSEKISLAKRTMLTKLYALEQEISVFENDFPTEFQNFQSRIETLRANYCSSLKELEKKLRFEINPEIDGLMLGEVVKLERDIEKFLQREVRFNILSKQLQKLITKLNILYNVSIFHTSEKERESIQRQLLNALEVEIKIVQDFISCDYVLNNEQLKERIVSLLSYVDYHIFKTSLRVSKQLIEEISSNLVLLTHFNGFDEESSLKAFLQDELSDLIELFPYISDLEIQRNLQKDVKKIIISITSSANEVKLLSETSIWKQFFNFESTLLEILKSSGVEKEKAKVKLLERMNISVEEKEVLSLPYTNAFLSLTNVYANTQDIRVLILLKLLKRISKDVTYKEIYFLVLLFGGLNVLDKNENSLIHHLESYIERYPYSEDVIRKKKQLVIEDSTKNYLIAFRLDEYQSEIVKKLTELKMDFKVENGNLLLNSFYFNGMSHVLASLQVSNN